MKLIHICKDEKFIDDAIYMFASIKNVDSFFFIYTQNKDGKLNFIKNKSVTIFTSIKKLLYAVNASKNTFVMLHSLFLPYDKVLKINQPIIWNSWGFDIYSDIEDPLKKIFSLPLYKPQTRSLLKNIQHKDYKLRFLLFVWKMTFLCKKRQIEYNRITQKTAYFSTVLPIEFDLITTVFPSAKYCPFHYLAPPTKEYFVQKNDYAHNNRILLGNSNDPTNNHLDVLEKLNALKTTLEIIIPFSYPDKDSYYSRYLKSHPSVFSYLKITFIHDFLDRDKYFQLIDSCSIAIFGHLRQQAVGNINYCLGTGKKVFFYEDSILYRHYQAKGYKIFTIENELSTDNITSSLDSTTKEHNQDILSNEWNYNNELKSLQLFFNDLNKTQDDNQL